MPETKARLRLKEFEDRARAARDSWVKETLKGSRLEERIKKQLNTSLESMIWYILGLEPDGWGPSKERWRISRVNGREPALYHALTQAIEGKAHDVVATALEEPITLSKQQRDSIRKEYTDMLLYAARDASGARAERDASDAVDRVLQELDEDTKPFCPVCQVRHLEPLHDPETQEPVDAAP